MTKPISEQLKKCLSHAPEDGLQFPIKLERATLEGDGPVNRQILDPLCRHLKSLATGQIGRPASTAHTPYDEHDSRQFEWL